MGHQFVRRGGGGFRSLPAHQHLAKRSQEQRDCTGQLNWWCGLCSPLENCAGGCGSVTRPPPPPDRKEGKWRLISIFFCCFLALSANFLLLNCVLVAKVILMRWKYETSQTGRGPVKYLTDGFLRKEQMRESAGGLGCFWSVPVPEAV